MFYPVLPFFENVMLNEMLLLGKIKRCIHMNVKKQTNSHANCFKSKLKKKTPHSNVCYYCTMWV